MRKERNLLFFVQDCGGIQSNSHKQTFLFNDENAKSEEVKKSFQKKRSQKEKLIRRLK
jgi:hypothetical protein